MRDLTYSRRIFSIKKALVFGGIVILSGFVGFAIAGDRLLPLGLF